MPGQVFGRGYPIQPLFSGQAWFWHPGGEEYTAPLPTSKPDATGRPSGNHLFYAANSATWWILWVAGNDDATLRSAWSTDLLTWTPGDTTTLTLGLDSGFNLAVAYRNISATDVVHIGYGRRVSATAHHSYHLRATISGTTITFEASAELLPISAGNDGGVLATDAVAVCLDSTNKIFQAAGYTDPSTGFGNPASAVSTNADAGTSWTSGFANATQHEVAAQLTWSAANFDIGSAAVLAVFDNAAATTTHTDLRWVKYTGSWSAPANVFGSSSTQDADDWGAVARTTGDVHVVRRLTSTTYEHRRFSGTSWSAGQAIPTQANKATAGVFLASDGTDVWLFVIDSDSANTVRYVKWASASSTWGSWTAFESSTQVRTALSGHRGVDAAGTFGICWTEVLGTGFQIVTKPLSTITAQAATGQGAAGFAGTATGVKVAPASGLSPAGAASAGTARKVAPVAGSAAAGATGTGAVVKRATPTAATAAGAASRSVGVKVAAVVAVCAAGLATGGVGAHKAPRSGAAAAGFAATAVAAHKAALSASAAAGVASTAVAARKAPAGGSSAVGAASSGAGVRVATVTGRSALGAVGQAAAGRRVADSGGAAAGLSGTATAVRSAPVAGRCAAGLAASGVPVRVARVGAAAAAGVAGSSALTKRAQPAGSTGVGVAASAAASRRAAAVSTSGGGFATTAVGAARHPQAAVAAAGSVSTGRAARLVAATGRAALALASTATPVEESAATGTTPVGLVTAATGAKTAPTAGIATAGAATRSVAAHTAPRTGTAAAGLTSTAAAARVVAVAAVCRLGLATAGTGVLHVAARTGSTNLGGASSGTVGKTGPRAAASTLGLAAAATQGKKAATGGGTQAGLVSAGVLSTSSAVPETGRAAAGLTSTAATAKIVHPAASTTLGTAGRATPTRVAAVAGTCGGSLTTAASATRAAPAAATTPLTATATATSVGHHGPIGDTAFTVTTRAGVTHVGAGAGRTPLGVAATAAPAVPPVVVVPPLYPPLAALRDCVAAALAATPAGRPHRVCVVAGVVAWDDCTCGQLTVAVTRVYPSRTFPFDAGPDAVQVSCPPPLLAVDATVTVLRCAPGPGPAGRPPTCGQLAAAAAGWRADAAAVMGAVVCCLPGLRDDGHIDDYAVRDLVPVGPQGGCVGLEQHLTFAVCNPGCR